MSKYLGVINNLLSGSYISPFSKKSVSLPIDEIVIERSIENIKFKFTKNLLNKKNLVISGENSFKAFGEKVLKSLRNNNLDFDINILKKYESSQTFAANLSLSSKEYENIIVIGSGSLIDLCKFVSFKNNQNLIVFCSSLTAAATTSTVSLTNDGVKETIKSKIAQSIIIDLENLRMAPLRLLRSALGDVLCRSTCQIDWLTSHLFLSTEYDETPFALQYEDERLLLDNSYKILEGDYDTLAALSRMTLLNGIAAIIIGSTHAGSMGEHLISHYIDMFMGEKHPGTLHGEQVAVTTLLLSRIQNQINIFLSAYHCTCRNITMTSKIFCSTMNN
jgi:glycerol-1-phosphate dehydrogenase [NAD(P)+]